MSKVKVGIVSLGCPKNTVDSERMMALLEQKQFQICSDLSLADVVLVNTCGFIEAAKKESLETIFKVNALKKQGRLKGLVVAGCLVNKYAAQLREQLSEADAFIGAGNISQVVEAVELALHQNGQPKDVYFSRSSNEKYNQLLDRKLLTPRYSAYLKISEGCNHRCQFCTIPMMRGKLQSRSIDSLIEETQRLVDGGVREINVIGQDTTEYGQDLYGKSQLPKLLQRLSKISDLKWIRLLYAFPAHVTDELIDVMAHEEKICRYLDMPVQHFDEELLKRSQRKLGGKKTLKLIEKLRKKIPGLALRTTVIVGLPGETEEKFAFLRQALREVRFERLGVFTYSDEEHAPSFKWEGKVSEKTKKQRQKQIMLLQQKISYEHNQKKIGQSIDVLLEKKEQNRWAGRSQWDAPEIDGLVYVDGENFNPGDFISCKITNAFEYDWVAKPL